MTLERNDWETALPLRETFRQRIRARLMTAARREVDLGLSHKNDLIVDHDDWSCVREFLKDKRHDWKPETYQVEYGLVRIALPADLQQEIVKLLLSPNKSNLCPHRDRRNRPLHGAPRMGRNRLMGLAGVELGDSELRGTPKVIGSLVNDSDKSKPQIAPPDVFFPPRRDLTRGAGVVVGVVDTEFIAHQYTDGAVLYRYQDVLKALRPSEMGIATRHSTFIAGLILNQVPGATVIVQHAMGEDGVAESIDVHDAVCRLAELGARVINLSLGCVKDGTKIPFTLGHAIEWARTEWGVRDGRAVRVHKPEARQPIFVAAAGNHDGSTRRVWPAADDRVWAVSAAQAAPVRLADFTGQGSWVNLSAPGDDVLSTLADADVKPIDYNAYGYWSGSSFATAVITGSIAAAIAGWAPDAENPYLTARMGTRTVPDAVRPKKVWIKNQWHVKWLRVQLIGKDSVTVKPAP